MIYELDYRYSSGVCRESKHIHMWTSESDLQAAVEALGYVRELIGRDTFFPDVLALTVRKIAICEIGVGVVAGWLLYQFKLPHGLIKFPEGMAIEDADPRLKKEGAWRAD